MDFIYHITTSHWWNKFSANETYETETFAEEKFIHCSTREQVKGVLERYYANQKELLLLHINPALLKAELKFEKSTGDEMYPHVYGKVNKDAIMKVEVIKP